MVERSDSVTSPECPSCSGPMVLRQNRRQGNSFWGCQRFPACRGTRDVESDSGEPRGGEALAAPTQVRVLWSDATIDRPGWQCRYTTAGGRLRCSPYLAPLASEFRQCWIARSRAGFTASETVRRVTGGIRKLIQRGSNPPIHPEAEVELLNSLGLGQHIRPSALPGDLSVQLEPDVFQESYDGSLSLPASDFEPDPQVLLGSDQERQFVYDWVPQNLGPGASRWFVPQAPFDALTAGLGDYGPSGRRVDFLVYAPFGTPFVVEIDGPQHSDASSPDAERDQILAKVDIEVVRIPTAEVDQGHGPNLERVRSLWASPSGVSDKKVADAVLVPVSIHRLAVALLDAVEAGFLSGQRWVVEVESDPDLAPYLLLWPYLRLFQAMDRLWGPAVMPETILLGNRNGWTRFEVGSSLKPTPCDPPDGEADVVVRLQPYRSGVDRLGPPQGNTPEVVVRSARLPVLVGDDLFEPDVRASLDGVATEDIKPALTEVLQAVFAKEDFREGQLEALTEIMEGRDCAVLLPTGGGKSLIYQMAGICKPGRTIVVDPLIALIEDQQRSLAEHGIDRVVGFSSFQVAQGRLDALLRQVTSGDALFIFVAPERLQQRRFRDSIRGLTQATPINLAVIDEAHCVSEWGHDFRTSYLTLGRVLRDVCQDGFGSSPPLLALTGTASRAVLKDVLAQLAISTESERSIVRPASFDRPELEMATRQCRPDESPAVLTGSLRALPSRFGVPPTEFFRPMAGRTFSGLIFCPHVNGRYGILELQRQAAEVVGFQPAVYSGGSPRQLGMARTDWERRKREFAESFKGNGVPLMVSTNAFGMGIDKPNIRYVLHYGMPGSIEAYYQEVGRAGRDQERAFCLLIWNERDRARSERLTMTDGSLEDIRRENASIRQVDSDSITQQLFFLLNTFRGVEVEVDEVRRLVADSEFLPNLGHQRTIELAKGTDEEASKRERAIYRLMLLGVVEDYLVESSFVVNLAGVSATGIADALVAFIKRSDPGAQRTAVAEFAAQASNMSLQEAVHGAARELVAFIYDVIVESRRRSLREMYVAARADSSAGDQIRDRVLDYLTEGDISPELAKLVDQPQFHYADWEQALAKLQGVDDARELRGSSARLLVSSPFHPGLLFARAYAEFIHPEGDLDDFTTNLEASLTNARNRYGVPQAEVDEFVGRVLLSLEAERFGGLSKALDVVDRLGLASETIAQIAESAMKTTGYEVGVRVIVLARRMTQISHDLDSAIEGLDNAE